MTAWGVDCGLENPVEGERGRGGGGGAPACFVQSKPIAILPLTVNSHESTEHRAALHKRVQRMPILFKQRAFPLAQVFHSPSSSSVYLQSSFLAQAFQGLVVVAVVVVELKKKMPGTDGGVGV